MKQFTVDTPVWFLKSGKHKYIQVLLIFWRLMKEVVT